MTPLVQTALGWLCVSAIVGILALLCIAGWMEAEERDHERRLEAFALSVGVPPDEEPSVNKRKPTSFFGRLFCRLGFHDFRVLGPDTLAGWYFEICDRDECCKTRRCHIDE